MSSTGALSRGFRSPVRDRSEPRLGSVPLWETAFVCAGLFLSTNAVMPLLFGATDSQSPVPATDPISHRAWLLVFLLVVIGSVRIADQIFAATVRNVGLVAICYIALVSTIWSAVPSLTLKNSLELTFSTFFGLYVGVRFGVVRLVAMIAWTTGAITLLSILFALALPRYGLDPAHGEVWRGVFTQKNELGRVMVVGLVVWIIRTLTGETKRVTGVAMAAAAAVVGLESGSRTALGVGGLMIGVFLMAWLLSRPDRRLVPVKGLIVSALVLVTVTSILNLKLLLAVVGSDYSLTGRAGIWKAVWAAVKVHAWIGYGYGGFWGWPDGPSVAVARAAGTLTPHSHNGYLDLLLDLGAVGFAATVAALWTVWRRALALLRDGVDSARWFPFVYLSLLLLYNATESSLVRGKFFMWIVFAGLAGALTVGTRPEEASVEAPAAGQVLHPVGPSRP